MKPALALTMGDPGGVGPEITVKAWEGRQEHSLPPFFVIAPATLYEAVDPTVPIARITDPLEAATAFEHALPVLDVLDPVVATPGTASPDTALSVIRSLDLAVTFAKSGKASGIVTNPIQKSTLYAAGFQYPGHTEFLAAQFGMAPDAAVMMLVVQGLRVVPVTVHLPLKDVSAALTIDRLLHVARVTAKSLKDRFHIDSPRLALSGLNPHAGEDGTMGREEIDVIVPAIKILQDEGLRVTGPAPADTLFHERARATYDAALAMYHDQALIPLKTLNFDEGVNVTLGLPLIRTSPDHGTALDIAGKGIASPASLIAALRLAGTMAAGG